MIMDAITGYWVQSIGGVNIIGAVIALPFLFVIGYVFYRITT